MGPRRQSVSAAKPSISHSLRKISQVIGANGVECQPLEQIDRGLKDKLSYDWKQIYRKLNANDLDNSGRVSLKNFKEVLHQTNTFISKEDL